MSLVAYAASDDSDTDEEETADISPQDDNIDGIPTYNGQISDEEDYMPTNRNEDLSSSPSSLSGIFSINKILNTCVYQINCYLSFKQNKSI